MVFVTGDTHGNLDLAKLLPENWEEGWKLTKEDFLIILGDVGLLWTHEPTKDHEIPLTDFYNACPWTTLWLPGNHENYDRISQLQPVEFDGMTCRKHHSWKSIYMLESGGQTIQGKKCFVYRGGESIDKRDRMLGHSYWREEIPSYQEFHQIADNLELYCKLVKDSMITTTMMPVDEISFVLSHTCPKDFFWQILRAGALDGLKFQDPVMDQLQAFKETLDRGGMHPVYFCGHFHIEFDWENFHVLYQRIERII